MTVQHDSGVLGLLHRQYRNLETYCNAQTRIQNALIEEKRTTALFSLKLHAHLDNLQSSLQQVQSDLRQLQTIELGHPRLQRLLVAHIERSRRILKTIYNSGGAFHANGIPVYKDDVETKTVALASLNASIADLERKIG